MPSSLQENSNSIARISRYDCQNFKLPKAASSFQKTGIVAGFGANSYRYYSDLTFIEA
jgi:hypothetical protein